MPLRPIAINNRIELGYTLVSIPDGKGFASLKESIPEVRQMRKGLYRAMRQLSIVASIRVLVAIFLMNTCTKSADAQQPRTVARAARLTPGRVGSALLFLKSDKLSFWA